MLFRVLLLCNLSEIVLELDWNIYKMHSQFLSTFTFIARNLIRRNFFQRILTFSLECLQFYVLKGIVLKF